MALLNQPPEVRKLGRSHKRRSKRTTIQRKNHRLDFIILRLFSRCSQSEVGDRRISQHHRKITSKHKCIKRIIDGQQDYLHYTNTSSFLSTIRFSWEWLMVHFILGEGWRASHALSNLQPSPRVVYVPSEASFDPSKNSNWTLDLCKIFGKNMRLGCTPEDQINILGSFFTSM